MRTKNTNLTAEPFVDEVSIHVQAGRGGDGMVHFRREKYVPRGGPDGGDGGWGGDVVFKATPHLNTLNLFRRMREIKADNGKHGGVQRQTGASGQPAVLEVPFGTLIYDAEQNHLLADLNQECPEYVVAKGGKGGAGNWHFRSSINQAPKLAKSGKEGEAFSLRLELRLLADVAFIGFPNAGKSSTIRSISRAQPKVADYPFTTLVPNLGVVQNKDEDGFVVADIPGLIEGASGGAGLGHQFLRHVSRARLLVHVLDLAEGIEVHELLKRHETIMNELVRSPVDIESPVSLVMFNKADLVSDENRVGIADEFAQVTGLDVLWTSTATREGMETLVTMLDQKLGQTNESETAALSAEDRIWGSV